MTDIKNKRYIYPLFCEGIIKNDNLYAFDNRLSAMCKANLKDMSMDILECYESEEPIFVKRIFAFGDTFVLQHERSLNLVIYDTKEGTYFECFKNSSVEGIFNVIQLQQELVFIPLNWTNEIIVFDLDKRVYSDYQNLHIINDESIMVLRPNLYKNSIIFPTQNENSFFQIKKWEKNINKISLIPSDVIPHIVKGDGNNLWVIEEVAEKLYGFGSENIVISIPPGRYGDIAVLEKFICLMPLVGYQLIIISKEDKTVRALGEISESSTGEMYGKVTSHVYCIEDNEYIYLFPNDNGFILKVNKTSYEINHCGFACKEYEKKMMQRYFGDDLIRYEERGKGLSQFIEMIR